MPRLLLVLLALLVPMSLYGREVTDALGTRVRLSDHPTRIVTLMPSLGELASDFCESDLSRIVGASDFTTYPPGLKKVPSVGPYNRFSIEKVVALKPDLVLASYDGNSRDQVMHLRELGLSVVVVKTDSFPAAEDSIRMTGTAMGDPAGAEQMATRFHEGIDRVRERARKHPGTPPKVLLQVGDDPLVVAGGKTLLNEALTAVGATNLYSDSTIAWPHPGIEDVIHRAPDVILVLVLNAGDPTLKSAVSRWKRYPEVPAIKHGRVSMVQADALLRPTLRLIEGLALLERRVHE